MNHLLNFLEQYTIKRYKKGEIILQQDSQPSGTFVIKKGVVKIYNLTSRGEEKPIGFSVVHDIFPLGWTFGKIVQSQYYYEAMSDCQVYTVPSKDLVALLHNTPEAVFQVADSCVRTILNYQMRINALEQSKASEKVLCAIHYLSLCFGRDVQKDVVEISLPLTQQDLANFMGLTRETVSAELKKLADKRVIFSRGQNYVILTNKLNELLDDDYTHRLVR